jgi:hypothetical protein
MPSPQNREKVLFALALEKPADMRRAFLGGNPRGGGKEKAEARQP